MKKLTIDEEYALIRKAQGGDTEAVHQIYLLHEDLILKIGHSLLYKNIELDDLKQEGFIGISEAINRFDFSKKLRFITFAYFWIYNKISKYTRDNAHTVRPSANLINLAIQVKKYSNQYWKRFNEYPSVQHLAKQYKTTVYYMREVLSLFPDDISLDQEIVPDTDITPMDYFYSKSIENRFFSPNGETKLKLVSSLLSEADPVHKDILEKSFGIGQRKKNTKQIAKIYKISEHECKKLQANILSSLTQKVQSGKLSLKLS